MITPAHFLLACAVAFFCVLLARMVWEPLFKRGVAKVQDLNYSLFDFLVLVAYLAIAAASTRLSVWHPLYHVNIAHWVFLIFACTFAVSLWWCAIHRLAAVGISEPGRRAILLLVALPMTVAVLSVMAFVVIMSMAEDARSGRNVPWVLLTSVPGVMLLAGTHMLVHWIVGPTDQPAQGDFDFFDD